LLHTHARARVVFMLVASWGPGLGRLSLLLSLRR